MCDSLEYGKCDICGSESRLMRKYYHYDIKCECCITSQNKHFEIVRYCDNCTPQPPRKISASVIPDEQVKPRDKVKQDIERILSRLDLATCLEDMVYNFAMGKSDGQEIVEYVKKSLQ